MYNQTKKVTVWKLVSCTSWTVGNLISNVLVHFSLEAVDGGGQKGPGTYITVRARPIGEDAIVHMHEEKQCKNEA